MWGSSIRWMALALKARLAQPLHPASPGPGVSHPARPGMLLRDGALPAARIADTLQRLDASLAGEGEAWHGGAALTVRWWCT
jgi:hypothetical protein